uniref:peptidylprolyl isomerase n=1 Tax=Entomoneis paludosa TaxID=265537 RepID=A0A7S2VB87_9STRA|mmetsp:Transcript_15458/g.31931  ORF Transcript_15458/g.31931 Transcript_15458/m.31931 type:complete len:277 (+) Transcript_15458:100-930(+)
MFVLPPFKNILLLLALSFDSLNAFAPALQPSTTLRSRIFRDNGFALSMTSDYEANSTPSTSRSQFLRQSLLATVAATTAALTTSTPFPACAATEEEATMFQLPSGIKYLELKPGTGPTPEYGQLVSIAYKGYIKLPANKNNDNPSPTQFDASAGYLMKHGNGRTIVGLDEGLHTLRVGGTRRIVIPPKLGYVTSGLGPIPEYPWDRATLNRLLDDMVRLRGGTVVFEVTLLGVRNDEADQGYYQDGSLTPDEFNTLRNNIQQRAAEAAEQAAQKQG